MADGITALLLLVEERLGDERVEALELFGGQEVTADEFSEGEADGVLGLRGDVEVEDIVQDILNHIRRQPP